MDRKRQAVYPFTTERRHVMKTTQIQVSEALQKTASAFRAIEQISKLPEFEDLFSESLIQHSDRLYEATLFLGKVIGHMQVCDVLKSNE